MKKFLLLAALLPSLAFGHGAPVIWNGTSAKWLPSGLNSAGVCKLSASGVMSSSTVSDSELATSYVKADGTRALTGNWNVGAFNITANSFIGSLTGNASTASALASNPSDCAAGTKATAIDASGNLTCSAASLTADVSGILPLANGGTSKSIAVAPGGLVYTDSDSMEVGAAGTAGQAAISGGTGAPTWYAPTLGSVLFAGTGGILAQDNSNFFWDDTNNRLGIGAASPSGTLDVTNVNDSIRGNIVLWGQGRGANSEWLIYDSPTGDISIYNPNQGVYGWSCRATGGCAFGAYSLGSANQMLGIKNNAGEISKSTLALELIGSQSGDFLTAYSTGQGSVLAKIAASGAGAFAGLTVSTLGTGIAHVNSSGVVSSSAVNLAGGSSEVTGTLPVGNGGTGATTNTLNGVLIGNGTSAISALAPTTAGAILSANGSGAAPIYTTATYPHTVTSGSVMVSTATNVWRALSPGTNGQVLTMSGAAPTWAAAGSGSSINENCVLDTGAGTANGTTNTTVRNFANATDTGSGCTSDVSSTANGSKVTINTAGLWSITYTDNRAGGSFEICITKNSSGLSTQCRLLTASQRLQQVAGTTDRPAHVTWIGRLAVNDIIRGQNDTNASDTTSYVKMILTRIGD